MLPGHFAAGLAIKTIEPRAPTFGLMVGVGLLDLVFGIGVMLGVEGGSIGHLVTPWSHSLAMAVVWSLLYAAWFVERGVRVAAAIAAASFSHWLLDLASHGPDMTLWPYSPIALGYGRWLGGLGGWFEVLVTILGTMLYVRWARRQADGQRRLGVIVAVLTVALGAEIAVVG